MAQDFTIRTYNRFPVYCTVFYRGQNFLSRGTAWNLSRNGWRVDGERPMEKGATVSLLVFLPDSNDMLSVDQARVQWSRGQEFGLKILKMPEKDTKRLGKFVQNLVEQPSGLN